MKNHAGAEGDHPLEAQGEKGVGAVKIYRGDQAGFGNANRQTHLPGAVGVAGDLNGGKAAPLSEIIP